MPKQLEPKPEGFAIHRGKGFHIIFANGCTASVQFGTGNYADSDQVDFRLCDHVSSSNAEIAAWDRSGTWLHPDGFDWSDDVLGWQSPAEVLKFLIAISEIPDAPSS